ncbi:MAG: aminoglycoside phosphotransferase family protein [Candidatus Bathyarchaeia archaeon]
MLSSKQLFKLQDYLNSIDFEKTTNHVKVLDLKLYEKQGLSNTIYLLKIEIDDGFTKEFILKVYQHGDKEALKESKILNVLYKRGVPVPKVYASNIDRDVLGKPFIIMEKIRQDLIMNEYMLVDAAAESLTKIHSVALSEIRDVIETEKDYPLCDLKKTKALAFISMLTTLGKPAVFADLFNYARDLEGVFVKSRLKLTHGDYSFDNIIYSDGKAYIIDWESADAAEPTFDVAYIFNLLDFSDKMSGRTGGKLSDAFIESYEKYGGIITDFQFYRKMAALKLLAILEAVSRPGLMAFMFKEFRRRTKSKDVKLLLESFKRYLRRILSGEN